MVDKKTLTQRTEDLFREILLKCFVQDDEVDTRVGIYAEIRSREKTKDANERAALKDVEKKFNDARYIELIVMYDDFAKEIKKNKGNYDLFEEELKEDKKPLLDENAPLFDLVFNTKKIKELSLAFEGDEFADYLKIKAFEFENRHYVLLKNKANNKEQYYFYLANYDKDNNLKERLVPVKDETLVRFFKDLGY